MASLKKYIMMGVSPLLLPLATVAIQRLIGRLNKSSEIQANQPGGQNDPDVPQQTIPNRG